MSSPPGKTFDLFAPEPGWPIVVEVPHAGLAIPDDVRAQLRVGPDDVLRDSDTYVDRIWAGAPAHGAALLVARVSRYVVDLNRAPDDVGRDVVPDHPAPRPTQPRGVVWRATTDGRPALEGPLAYRDLVARLDRYHTPYHQALADVVARMRARASRVIVLAAHSMPSRARGGARRADVVPGTRGGSTAAPELVALVDEHFRRAGLSVRHDDPYRGGWTTGRWGLPSRGIHAIQIELNRALYLHEPTGRPDEAAIAQLGAVVDGLVSRLAALG